MSIENRSKQFDNFFLKNKMTAPQQMIQKYYMKEEIILIMPPNKYLDIQSTYLIPMSNKTKSVKFSVENSVFNPFYGLNINFFFYLTCWKLSF